MLSAMEQSDLITPSFKYYVQGKSFCGLEKGAIFLNCVVFFLCYEWSPVVLYSVRVVVVIMLCFDRHHHLISTLVYLTFVILLVSAFIVR